MKTEDDDDHHIKDPLFFTANAEFKNEISDSIETTQAEILRNEKTTLEYLKSFQDDDVLFFQSLLPYMKMLGGKRKEEFKQKLKKLVILNYL